MFSENLSNDFLTRKNIDIFLLIQIYKREKASNCLIGHATCSAIYATRAFRSIRSRLHSFLSSGFQTTPVSLRGLRAHTFDRINTRRCGPLFGSSTKTNLNCVYLDA